MLALKIIGAALGVLALFVLGLVALVLLGQGSASGTTMLVVLIILTFAAAVAQWRVHFRPERNPRTIDPSTLSRVRTPREPGVEDERRTR